MLCTLAVLRCTLYCCYCGALCTVVCSVLRCALYCGALCTAVHSVLRCALYCGALYHYVLSTVVCSVLYLRSDCGMVHSHCAVF